MTHSLPIRVSSNLVDVIGRNYYTGNSVKADPHQWPVGASPVRQVATHTTTDWEVYPPALTDMLVWFRDTYGDIPVYITENGPAFYDPPKAGPAGIDAPLRCDYLRTHNRSAEDTSELQSLLTLS